MLTGSAESSGRDSDYDPSSTTTDEDSDVSAEQPDEDESGDEGEEEEEHVSHGRAAAVVHKQQEKHRGRPQPPQQSESDDEPPAAKRAKQQQQQQQQLRDQQQPHQEGHQQRQGRPPPPQQSDSEEEPYNNIFRRVNRPQQPAQLQQRASRLLEVRNELWVYGEDTGGLMTDVSGGDVPPPMPLYACTAASSIHHYYMCLIDCPLAPVVVRGGPQAARSTPTAQATEDNGE